MARQSGLSSVYNVLDGLRIDSPGSCKLRTAFKRPLYPTLRPATPRSCFQGEYLLGRNQVGFNLQSLQACQCVDGQEEFNTQSGCRTLLRIYVSSSARQTGSAKSHLRRSGMPSEYVRMWSVFSVSASAVKWIRIPLNVMTIRSTALTCGGLIRFVLLLEMGTKVNGQRQVSIGC